MQSDRASSILDSIRGVSRYEDDNTSDQHASLSSCTSNSPPRCAVFLKPFSNSPAPIPSSCAGIQPSTTSLTLALSSFSAFCTCTSLAARLSKESFDAVGGGLEVLRERMGWVLGCLEVVEEAEGLVLDFLEGGWRGSERREVRVVPKVEGVVVDLRSMGGQLECHCTPGVWFAESSSQCEVYCSRQ